VNRIGGKEEKYKREKTEGKQEKKTLLCDVELNTILNDSGDCCHRFTTRDYQATC
jgi:hypothetical protein